MKPVKLRLTAVFLFCGDMCYYAVFFTLWEIYFFCLLDDAIYITQSPSHLQEVFSFTRKSANVKINIVYFRLAVGGDANGRSVSENSTELPEEEKAK